ncbi:MAG TPA: hypothetical protein VM933_06255 [Acidimicrobiales bacterium]|nr:hypothetical protein [Acidimicrobiales bacterium]
MSARSPFAFRWGDELGVRSWARAVDAGATVVLHDGPDERWLALDAPERFADWAELVSARLAGVRSWVSVQGLNRWPVERYAGGGPGRLASGRLLRALDHQLAGHVLASDRLPGAVEPGLVDDHRAYELQALLADVLAAPSFGVGRHEVGPWLRERKTAFEADHPTATPRQWAVRRLAGTAIPLEQALPRALGAVYATDRVMA